MKTLKLLIKALMLCFLVFSFSSCDSKSKKTNYDNTNIEGMTFKEYCKKYNIKDKNNSELPEVVVDKKNEEKKAAEICSHCRGTGKLICSTCSGTGKLKHVCSQFKEECPTCSGNGAVSNGEDIYVCPKCDGRGTICMHCKDGSKHNPETCYKCDGYGYSICSWCGGDGKVESIIN